MRFLLDTNIISEWSKPKPHGGVLAWFAAYPPSEYAIPSVALYELQAGIELARPNHPGKAAELTVWTDRLIRASIILPLDDLAAREAARLIHGKSLDLLEDAMIAATARVKGLTIATRNTKDFYLFDVPLINPFLFKAR